MSEANNAAQAPLVDMLRSAPKGNRHVFDEAPFASRSFPYGQLCHAAADRIEALEARVRPSEELPTGTQLVHAAALSICIDALEEVRVAASKVKDALDAVPPSDRPACRNSTTLTWPLSTVGAALKIARAAAAAIGEHHE